MHRLRCPLQRKMPWRDWQEHGNECWPAPDFRVVVRVRCAHAKIERTKLCCTATRTAGRETLSEHGQEKSKALALDFAHIHSARVTNQEWAINNDASTERERSKRYRDVYVNNSRSTAIENMRGGLKCREIVGEIFDEYSIGLAAPIRWWEVTEGLETHFYHAGGE
jgi:hypothetical protein